MSIFTMCLGSLKSVISKTFFLLLQKTTVIFNSKRTTKNNAQGLLYFVLRSKDPSASLSPGGWYWKNIFLVYIYLGKSVILTFKWTARLCPVLHYRKASQSPLLSTILKGCSCRSINKPLFNRLLYLCLSLGCPIHKPP